MPHLPKDAPAPAPPPRAARGRPAILWPAVIAVGVAALFASGLAVRWVLSSSSPPASVISVKPTPSLLVAVRDLARLETTELHIEKVIDLTDKQSRLFGLVEATDAILLVAVGRATVGVDLAKLREGDVAMDPATKSATLKLPNPELLGAALDEKSTYVYTRSTSVLAKRNEALETQARREALEAVKKAALTDDVMDRSRAQAERQLRALLMQLGAASVTITWR